MTREEKNIFINRLICSDTRFSLPDVLNDHCWEVGTRQNQSPALSMFTTYGLRASRMLVFPSFTLEDLTIQDPAQFYARPEVRFYSTNFITLVFSPFQGIDVQYNLWVPTSQMVAGEVSCFNQSETTKSMQVNWQVHLSPLRAGSPMKHTQFGLSTVLQGECADLFPVFYLSGEASPSRSAIPGLTTRYLLMPSGSKRSTWVLASLSSSDASFQMARQYSSKSLDVEKLRIEMADKLDQVHITSTQSLISEMLRITHVRLRQLLMPPQAKFKFRTIVNTRDTETGFYPRNNLLEINPEWSGQTLPQLWMMAQSLLPGNPELVRGLIMNMLSRQSTRGGVDHRVGVNGGLTGHSALPLIAQLVADLHPILNDPPWLAVMYPALLDSLKTWIINEPDGSLRVQGLTHPIQLGAQFSGQSELAASEIWMKLKSNNHVLVTALLIREVTELIQISRWLDKTAEIPWLEKVKEQLVSLMLSYRDEKSGLFRHPESTSDHTATGTIVHAYKRNGLHKPRRKLPAKSKLYLRISGEEHLPADFSCTITIGNAPDTTTLHIRTADLKAIGNTRIFVSDQECDFLESIEIRNLPAGLSVEVGQPDYARVDLFQLLSLYAGVLTTSQVDQLLRHLHVQDFYGTDGISLLPSHPDEPALLAPAYLVGLIVEGLLRYEKVHLAGQVFHHHFTNRFIKAINTPDAVKNPAELTLDDLVPARLFLKIRGVVRLTDREVIISHFIKRKQDAVTVQYNKIELKLKPFLNEIHTQSGDVIYLNRAGPNRVLLD